MNIQIKKTQPGQYGGYNGRTQMTRCNKCLEYAKWKGTWNRCGKLYGKGEKVIGCHGRPAGDTNGWMFEMRIEDSLLAAATAFFQKGIAVHGPKGAWEFL